MGPRADDQLIAETTTEGLLLRPAVTLPIENYSAKPVREFDEADAERAKVLDLGRVEQAAVPRVADWVPKRSA